VVILTVIIFPFFVW
jgi:predicted RNase H-like nuclease (RuvC/YqgF family)